MTNLDTDTANTNSNMIGGGRTTVIPSLPLNGPPLTLASKGAPPPATMTTKTTVTSASQEDAPVPTSVGRAGNVVGGGNVGNVVPPTPAVNRRLEFPGSSAKSRSRSAPPARPPPPPPPRPPLPSAATAGANAGAGPPTTNVTKNTKTNTATKPKKTTTATTTSTGRGATKVPSNRPTPVTPSALLKGRKVSTTSLDASAPVAGGGGPPIMVPSSRNASVTTTSSTEDHDDTNTTAPNATTVRHLMGNSIPRIASLSGPPYQHGNNKENNKEEEEEKQDAKNPATMGVATTTSAAAAAATAASLGGGGGGAGRSTINTISATTTTTTTTFVVGASGSGSGSDDGGSNVPPPLASSSFVVQTPVPSHHNNINEDKVDTPPSSGSSQRREKMKLLRAAASEAASAMSTTVLSDTNDGPTSILTLPPLVAESTKRLEEAYAKAQKEKKKALQQVKELEERLAQSLLSPPASNITDTHTNDTSSSLALEHLLHLAEAEGPHAAVEWAKSQTKITFVGDGATTPMPKAAGGMLFPIMMGTESPLVRRRIANRVATPAPTRRYPGGTTTTAAAVKPPMSATDIERQKISFFKEAAQSVPYEYTSDLATYNVRRPYGLETVQELFDLVSPVPHGEYSKRAHVSSTASIEVAVTVLADHSLLLLYGVAGVRYKTNPNAREWKVVSNVDDADRPLGHVMYIDEQANECEYSLDQIFEEAILVREQYCSTMTSMALSLEHRPKTMMKEEKDEKSQQPKQGTVPESVNVPNPSPAEPPAAGPVQPGPNKKEESVTTAGGGGGIDKPKQAASTNVDDPNANGSSSGSADVLIVFIGMMASTIFGGIYFVLIGLPIRIIQTTVIFCAVYGLMTLLYMYAAQDYNDWLAQSIPGTLTANELAYFSNQRPGIL